MQLFLLTVCFIVTTTFSYGNDKVIVKSIDFAGNHQFTENQLLDVMIIKPNSQFSLIQITNDITNILNLYHRYGYYFACVRVDSLLYSSDSTMLDIRVAIVEGDRVTLDSITVVGNVLFSDSEILKMFDTHTGNYLIPDVLEKDISQLLTAYDQRGYPFAKIDIENIYPIKIDSVTKLRLNIAIEEGQKVTIDEIRVAGNKITKEEVIVRETRIKLHALYNQEKVSRILPRLNRLNIFSKVEEPELYTTSSGGGLLIKIEEGNTNTFDGILGYAPGASINEKGIITGMINISMRNLFGTARKLNVRWQRDGRKSQEVALAYVEPWIFDFPLNLSVGFNQRQQDTIYVKRGIEARADLLMTESLTIEGMFAQENVIPSNSINVVAQSRTTLTGIDIQYDTRDDLLSPRSGVFYKSMYQVGNKTTANQSITIQRISLDADFFINTFQRQVAMLGIHGRSLSSSRIELSDLYRFGGTNTLRGYRENQFVGSRIAWTNAEYRFLLARRSFFYGFFDSGYYYLPGDDTKNVSSYQKVKYGYGIGVHLETALGNIGVSFAFGEGDSFLQGKIHIGLINEF